ncbi:glutathione synthase [Polynucleobacter kasalickyi]|uniref:Glutathione synthetase n=1 Tax=Polynucleobacter kasalickyi TaxID=1938817 RepID=A0A1W2ARZ1_9BURK|nr:glutathione synthase [Polynucleobacter kasalickyi]SMC63509.1 glutathione synthase [Polynucleobacter kasalickyi]
MQLLFIADPIESFKPYKDSTLAMMVAAQAAGHEIFYAWSESLASFDENVTALAVKISVDKSSANWFTKYEERRTSLCDFDAVLMRQDPPFSAEYLANTLLLSQAERLGAKVFNDPSALRDHSEKVAILEFPELIAPTTITRELSIIRAFHQKHQDIIIKPLDGMGGMGVFRVGKDGLNLGSIVETLGNNGARSLMVQKYIPEITQGDNRILLIDGEPIPYLLARIPQEGDIRGNLAAGGKGVARPLTENELCIAKKIGTQLANRGLFLVGIDMIGSYLTEINVTSPTCFVEIFDQTGFDVASTFIGALEKRIMES